MTIAELVRRRDELVAELEAVRAEIASRAGKVDPPPKTRKGRNGVGA